LSDSVVPERVPLCSIEARHDLRKSDGLRSDTGSPTMVPVADRAGKPGARPRAV